MTQSKKDVGVYARMQELGIVLPPPPEDSATLRLVRPLTQDIMYLSGLGPNLKNQSDKDIFGKVGGNVSEELGYQAARNTALNALSVLDGALGDLNRITEFIKLLVFVASDPDYSRQHIVANGASELLISIFGAEIGQSARSAIGVAVLPNNIPVETEMIVRYQ